MILKGINIKHKRISGYRKIWIIMEGIYYDTKVKEIVNELNGSLKLIRDENGKEGVNKLLDLITFGNVRRWWRFS